MVHISVPKSLFCILLSYNYTMENRHEWCAGSNYAEPIISCIPSRGLTLFRKIGLFTVFKTQRRESNSIEQNAQFAPCRSKLTPSTSSPSPSDTNCHNFVCHYTPVSWNSYLLDVCASLRFIVERRKTASRTQMHLIYICTYSFEYA